MLFDPRRFSAANVDREQLKATALQTAGAKAAVAVASRLSPAQVKLASQIVHAGQQLDNVFGPQFENTPNSLLGGMTPLQAMERIREIHRARPAMKANFYVRITDLNPPNLGSGLNAEGVLQLLAVDVSYNPATLTGDKVAIGGAVMDRLTGSEAVELRITTMDDEIGTLKSWFDAKCSQAVAQDGTFGLPRDYCVFIEVVHGLPDPEVVAASGSEPYSAHVWMRPVTVEHELSRREQALAELNMTFTQFDSFTGL
ncbi:hypothetical protein [Ideonella sp.]|uniref:hypothetical protein n=1 Tax=Ideonella sp. TaxID=1929293 RepID=UPI0035B333D7